MISDLNSPTKTDPQSYSPTFGDPLDDTLDLNLPPPNFHTETHDSSRGNSPLLKKCITKKTPADAFSVSAYIEQHFRKGDLPPLHKDPDFEDEVHFAFRDSERSYPIDSPFKGPGIRPSSESSTYILLEAEERLQRMSIGTLLSGTIGDLTYETIQTKLEILKALVSETLNLHVKNPNLNRHKIAQNGHKLIEQTKALQSLILGKSRHNDDLKDLNKELEKIKTLCFKPITLR